MQLAKRWDKELLTLWKVNKLRQVENVSPVIVHLDISFVEKVARVLNYSHTSRQEYGLPPVRAKTADIVQDTMSSNFSVE